MNSFIETEALMSEPVFQGLLTWDQTFSTVNTDIEKTLVVSALFSLNLFAYLDYLLPFLLLSVLVFTSLKKNLCVLFAIFFFIFIFSFWRSLDNVIVFNTHCYRVTLYLGGLSKSCSEFCQSWSMFNIWFAHNVKDCRQTCHVVSPWLIFVAVACSMCSLNQLLMLLL